MAELIEMLFGGQTYTGPRNNVLDGLHTGPSIHALIAQMGRRGQQRHFQSSRSILFCSLSDGLQQEANTTKQSCVRQHCRLSLPLLKHFV